MAEPIDIIIRNARLRAAPGKRHDIAIAQGRIASIAEHVSGKALTEIDAKGNLVTEAFVNPHLHLCKVWTLPMMQELALQDYQGAGMGKAMSAIELASIVKEKYAEDWIAAHARRAVALAAHYGNLHIRAFADVDGKAKLEAVKALLRVRDEFRGIVDLQVVAFAQDGIVREPGTEKLMREAMDLGADVVGGIPWIEFTDAEAADHIRICFDLATIYGKDVSMLLDDAGDAGLRTLEMMAVEAIERGWQGRALAHHCRAMALYPEPYFYRLVGTLKRAGVAVVSDPHTGPLHARVKQLLKAGVTVCLGQDDISDAYYPFGRNNVLEVAFLSAHLLWMMGRGDLETLYDLVTAAGAKAMNLPDYGLQPGKAANLVVLAHADATEALRFHDAPAAVISHGKLIDQAAMLAGSKA